MWMTGIGVAPLAPGKVGHDVTCRSKSMVSLFLKVASSARLRAIRSSPGLVHNGRNSVTTERTIAATSAARTP